MTDETIEKNAVIVHAERPPPPPKTKFYTMAQIKKVYADFNSKMQDDFLPKDACVALGIKDKWDGQFTARIGAEMFYEYLRQQLVEEMKQ